MTIREFFGASEELLDILTELDQQIFDPPMKREDFNAVLSTNNDVLVLIAYRGAKPVGFKLGHRHKDKIFLSRYGGVIQESRQMGVARALMEHQHNTLRQRGYTIVRTQTRNRFKDMLIFNLSFGFDLIGVSQSLDSTELSLLLEMRL